MVLPERDVFDRLASSLRSASSEFLTRDKKNILIENVVMWQDPGPARRFLQTVGHLPAAEMRLRDIIWSGLSAALGRQDLDALVSTQRATRSAELSSGLAAVTDRAALERYGISVVDVRIKRINFPEQNKPSVFARMRAERERIARQDPSREGEEQALSIRADADRQKTEILAAAYKEAEKTRGEGDAEATRIDGAAYSKNPRFYKLLMGTPGSCTRKCSITRPRRFWIAFLALLNVLSHGEEGILSHPTQTHTPPRASKPLRQPSPGGIAGWCGQDWGCGCYPASTSSRRINKPRHQVWRGAEFPRPPRNTLRPSLAGGPGCEAESKSTAETH